MNILTPAEISECLTGGPTAVARAIESALIARLAAGASVEPVAEFNWNEGKFLWLTKYDYHKHHQAPLVLQKDALAAVAAARVQALEEAANLVDAEVTNHYQAGRDLLVGMRDAIRALLGGPSHG